MSASRLLFPELRRALFPPKLGLQQRLAAFPTDGLPLARPVTVRWNSHHVPYVLAETDTDLAFVLGMIHIHLRATQIALFRMFFEGRLAEMFGPLARDIDHLLRLLDYGHAAAGIEEMLPPETRAWVEGFVDGMNHYQERMTVLPPEFALLGLKPKPYSVRDIICGGRIGGSDFAWLHLLPLLKLRGRPEFKRLWNRALEAGGGFLPTEAPRNPLEAFAQIASVSARLGSNSVVVAPSRSRSGGALIANDPHLGLSLPSLWLLVGVRSPSFRLVGVMICGLPIFAIGRSRHLAWGGTNMRAASSDLYDLSGLPAQQFERRTTRIRSRFWRSTERVLRRSPLGPVISDAPMLKSRSPAPFAMRWVGHRPTDEFTAFLRAARARSGEEVRAAFAGYAVSGQNILFADHHGNIGRVLAVTTPLRTPFPKDDPVRDSADVERDWQAFVDSSSLPVVLNPSGGLLASANDRPHDTDVPIGFAFAPPDRLNRLYGLLQQPKIGIDDLRALQTDVCAPAAADLGRALAADIRAIVPDRADAPLLHRLSNWDGAYTEGSSGAVAFETLVYHLVAGLNGCRRAHRLPESLGQWSTLSRYLLADLRALAPDARRRLYAKALARASRDASKYAAWGDMHRMRIGHMLAKLPLLGRRFVCAEGPIGGSRQTPLKMAHGLERGRHVTSFGQVARHISDMADPDANFFVLLGGQDGWAGSHTFADQIPLWRRGAYITMPLLPETIEAEFPIITQLRPAAPQPAEDPTAASG